MLTWAIASFGSGDEVPAFLRLLGRCHTAVVHFPIALFMVAAALESWQLVRRKPELSRATPVCLVIGALSAVAASLFGWLLNESDGGGGDLVGVHKWVGLVTTAAMIVAVVLVLSGSTARRTLLRLTVVVAAGLVSITGYLGGELVFGPNHLFKGVFEEKHSDSSGLALAPNDEHSAPALAVSSSTHSSAADTVDFTSDVVPILKQSCLRCHGGEKVKGKLNLATRSSAMKGGASGTSIHPGQAEKSPLYTMLVETKLAGKMPPPREKQLSREQVETIRKWIDQGAAWPENCELR